jgi:phage terminase large subunit-like protein
VHIRRIIELAGNKKLWKDYWPRRDPKIFWYFYPSNDIMKTEVEKKWVPDFLPKNEMKSHETYGWDITYDNGIPSALHFRSGVTVYFQTYGMRIRNLQATTVDYVALDEEPPEDYIDELTSRLIANDGYLSMVFTATIGQQLFYRAMECIGSKEESFPNAYKKTISLYDCQVYEDGSIGAWPLDRIKQREQMCTSENERLRRVMGRFVRDEGLRYHAFDHARNVVDPTPIPKDWGYYAGVDIGSGGKNRSKASIVIVAVSPENTKGIVTDCWRGDTEDTTAGDILEKYLEMTSKLAVKQAFYDHSSREFGLQASRAGVPMFPAQKNQSQGNDLLNSLFKYAALVIEGGRGENEKLITELSTVPAEKSTSRTWVDDLSDALKYGIAAIPWDFTKLGMKEHLDTNPVMLDRAKLRNTPQTWWTAEDYRAYEFRVRRGEVHEEREESENSAGQELFDYFHGGYENY